MILIAQTLFVCMSRPHQFLLGQMTHICCLQIWPIKLLLIVLQSFKVCPHESPPVSSIHATPLFYKTIHSSVFLSQQNGNINCTVTRTKIWQWFKRYVRSFHLFVHYPIGKLGVQYVHLNIIFSFLFQWIKKEVENGCWALNEFV